MRVWQGRRPGSSCQASLRREPQCVPLPGGAQEPSATRSPAGPCQTPCIPERNAKPLVNRGTAETCGRGAREQLKVRSIGKQGPAQQAWAGLRGALGPRTVLSSTATSGGHSLERCCRLPVMSPDIPQRWVQFRGQLCVLGQQEGSQGGLGDPVLRCTHAQTRVHTDKVATGA